MASAARAVSGRALVVRPERIDRVLSVGTLLVAGFFTFPFHRLLGTWLFG